MMVIMTAMKPSEKRLEAAWTHAPFGHSDITLASTCQRSAYPGQSSPFFLKIC